MAQSPLSTESYRLPLPRLDFLESQSDAAEKAPLSSPSQLVFRELRPPPELRFIQENGESPKWLSSAAKVNLMSSYCLGIVM